MVQVTERKREGLSVIIPCLNEAETVGTCVDEAREALFRHAIPGEVVVVDNGSSDDSARIAEERGARVIREERRGYGSAYMAGVRNAQFTYCLKGDADCSYDFSRLDLFWNELRKGDADIVVGTRLNGHVAPGSMPPLHRYLGTPVLTWILNLNYGGRLSDVNSGMRAFRTERVLDLDLCCEGMEFASEMLVKALKRKLEIREIPIAFRKDERKGKPHLKSFRDGWRHLRFLIVMSPFSVFLIPGLASIALGLALSFAFLSEGSVASADSEAAAAVRPFFGITTFACVQHFIILGEVLILMAYAAKVRLIREGIDVSTRITERLRRVLSLDRMLVFCSVVGILNGLWTVHIARNLLHGYRVGIFTPYYTKLGILNFTVFTSLAILFFAGFFVSEVGRR